MTNSMNTPQLKDKVKSSSSISLRSGVTKILVAGSGAVGKTTLLQVLKDNKPLEITTLSQEYHRTPFLNIETISVERIGGTGSRGIFLMVDVAGQLDLPIHALRDFSNLALGSVELVMLMFSADNLQSLLDLKDWVSIVKTQHKGNRPLQFVLIMNKCDLDNCIDRGLVEQFMESEPLTAGYFEISCRNGEGLDELQQWLVETTKQESDLGDFKDDTT
ncbi:MAG: GTPase domain-containing protein [Candidatus Thorarchaeota archaeon]